MSKWRWKLITGSIVILALAIAAGAWAWHDREQLYRTGLQRRVAACAAVCGTITVERLRGDSSDLNGADYQTMVGRLSALRVTDARLCCAFIVRRMPDGKIVYLVGSESYPAPHPTTKDRSYKEAAQDEGLQRMLQTGKPSVGDSAGEGAGPRVSAFAPLNEGPDGRDALGLHVVASAWRSAFWIVAL